MFIRYEAEGYYHPVKISCADGLLWKFSESSVTVEKNTFGCVGNGERVCESERVLSRFAMISNLDNLQTSWEETAVSIS